MDGKKGSCGSDGEWVNDGINSLQEIVRCILDVEAGQNFRDTWLEEAPLYQDTIKEELRKKGITNSAI